MHLDTMINAVRPAARICRTIQANLLDAGTVTKDDRSPVTVADFASQAIVSKLLGDVLPEIPLIAEEASAALRTTENLLVREKVVAAAGSEWDRAAEAEILAAIDRGDAVGGPKGSFFVLDPIDGTKGFLRGDQYAVALGLLIDGEVVAGVLGCPNLPGPDGKRGCLFAAEKGAGTCVLPLDDERADPTPVFVSACTDPARIRFCESVEKAHSHKGRAARVADALGVQVDPVGIDSQCKYGLVARGDAELYLRIPRDDIYVEKIWDHAAGHIVVTEAGGRVTDVNGDPLDFRHGRLLERNRGVVASNGPLHDQVLEALRRTA